MLAEWSPRARGQPVRNSGTAGFEKQEPRPEAGIADRNRDKKWPLRRRAGARAQSSRCRQPVCKPGLPLTLPGGHPHVASDTTCLEEDVMRGRTHEMDSTFQTRVKLIDSLVVPAQRS